MLVGKPSSASSSDRIKAASFFGGAFLIGAGALWYAIATLLSFAHMVGARAPLIALEPRDPGVVGLGITFLAFAAMPLVPGPVIGPRSHQKRRAGTRATVDGPAICMVAATAGLAVFALAPLIVVPVIAVAVDARGYVGCAPPDDERRAPMRWVQRTPGAPQGRCPTSWRDTHGG